MAQNVVEGGWRNKLAYMGLHDLQMPIIHTWNVSLNMWNYHTNYRCPMRIQSALGCICNQYPAYSVGSWPQSLSGLRDGRQRRHTAASMSPRVSGHRIPGGGVVFGNCHGGGSVKQQVAMQGRAW